MSEPAQPMRAASGYLRGPFSALGLAVAVATCALDQASKLWLLDVFRIGDRGTVTIAPVLDLKLTWNAGISYGLLQQAGAGRWLLLAVALCAVTLLWIWLVRAPSRLTAVSLGLIIGGALGNAIDRFAYGAVVDFVLFHITTATWRFDWFVFNVADAAIVAGVAGLLYELVLGNRAAKAP